MTNNRYACQINLPDFGRAALKQLAKSRVLIVGLGGLGCPAAQSLARAGIGSIGLVDFDFIEQSNLNRQTLFYEQDIGKLKVKAAKRELQRINKDLRITTYPISLTNDNVQKIVKQYDIVLDCTDNFSTRYLLNDACVLSKKPLIYGAALRYEGQVAVFNLANGDGSYSPHLRDIFPQKFNLQSENCQDVGVMPTLTNIIGTMQANEAIKYITSSPDLLKGKLLIFNISTLQSQKIILPKKSKVIVESLANPAKTISAQELKAKMASLDYRLIDVRSRDMHEKYNIGGESIPLNELSIKALAAKPNESIVFYCDIGRKSQQAADTITMQKPSINVFSLEGGLKTWQ